MFRKRFQISSCFTENKNTFPWFTKMLSAETCLHVKAVLYDHELMLTISVPDSYLKVCTLGQRNFCLGSLEAANFFLKVAGGLRMEPGSRQDSPEASQESASSSASSQSLISRHLHSVQIQVRSLQAELTRLQDSGAFSGDRLDNLESISRSLCSSVQELSDRAAHIERVQALQAAGLQAQAVSLSRLARRLANLEQASF